MRKLKNGLIVQSGRHDELLKSGGFYAMLYELQFRHEDEIPDGALVGAAS